MTAKPNCTWRGRRAGGELEKRWRMLAPMCCSVGCPQPRYPRGFSAGDDGHYSAGFADLQGGVALLVIDRLFQWENNQVSAQTRNQDRRPVFVVSDLNGDDTARREHLNVRLEVAGAFFYIGKFPEKLAARVDDGRPIFCAAQSLSPSVEQWIGRFHTLRGRLRAIKFRTPFRR